MWCFKLRKMDFQNYPFYLLDLGNFEFKNKCKRTFYFKVLF